MKITITSRHFKAHSSLNDYAEAAVQHLTKYYDGIVKAEVILQFEKARNSSKIAEINLSVYNAVLTGQAATADFFKSIDAASGKLTAQLKKYKERLHGRDRILVRRVREKI
ncbi:MAG: ribosome-associated translation inhibitor RaiA [Bacteroidota bacterium]